LQGSLADDSAIFGRMDGLLIDKEAHRAWAEKTMSRQGKEGGTLPPELKDQTRG